MAVATYRMSIAGQELDAASGRTFESLNPYTGQPWASAPDGDAADVDRAVAAARAALDGPWGAMTGAERARLMRRLGDILTRDAEQLAAFETRDNGKLLREMSGQMAYLPEWLYYFSGLADKLEGSAIPSDRPNFLVYTRHEPVGVVGAIVPWNSPLLLMAWKLAPALAAGCTFVVKPSDHTPISTLEFAARVQEAGFPDGVFNVVTGYGPAVGQALAAHPGVDKVAFTGSTETGIKVGHAAVDHLARFSLELGGKSAQVVFEDADLEAAANGVIAGVFAATGQTCMAGSRLLVQDSVHDELVRLIVERARTIRLGDPMLPDTEMGPLANAPQFEKVLGYVRAAQEDGATLAHGGHPDPRWAATSSRRPSSPTRGRTCAWWRRRSSAPSWPSCASPPRTRRWRRPTAPATASRPPCGRRTSTAPTASPTGSGRGPVWVNAYRVVAPNVPFGGVQMSGIGRENGIGAVRDYTETKAVWVELTGATRDPFTLG
jgi:aldehyde dehydrogenase (NAD+)